MRGFFLASVCLALLSSCFVKAQQPQNELIGTWEVTGFLDDNIDRMARLNKVGVPKLIVTATEIYLVDGEGKRFAGNALTNIGWTTYTLDAAKSPKQIRINGKVTDKGVESAVVYPGVYKVEGATLTIAYPESNQDKIGYPKTFVSDDDVNVIVARRIPSK